ncbi:MAG: MGMT family protein [Gemmatimonadetes bacterium]|jgi:methylated-DNA-protein-cysteine methyltransferase-like protein|nr:MGMT family protein [Gemmatimonadota bacterium]MBT4609746.1 MGMT family protein [Gemmatimonadota bacterium]MBT5058112.1 MGMT family protein [Gemmatimonadota bacterium]MBT5142448.1 MGMT family protein [Gemmatimonadota bacterium]MBT5586378.1 MGMT family protein [Gemmatimonadota bacterium]
MRRQRPTVDESGSRWRRFYAIVERIPEGSVATYGQIAELAGLKGHARQVGYALAALSEARADDVPWHRVINAKGEVSVRTRSSGHRIQRKLLEAEGIEFHRERVNLSQCRWDPEPGVIESGGH